MPEKRWEAIQISGGISGIINYKTDRNIEGITKFNDLEGLIKELRELFADGSKIEQIRLCGNTTEGHLSLAKMMPAAMCFSININLNSIEILQQ